MLVDVRCRLLRLLRRVISLRNKSFVFETTRVSREPEKPEQWRIKINRYTKFLTPLISRNRRFNQPSFHCSTRRDISRSCYSESSRYDNGDKNALPRDSIVEGIKHKREGEENGVERDLNKTSTARIIFQNAK